MPTPARNNLPPRISRAAGAGPPAWIAAAVLAIVIGAVYGRALDVPFILDDDSTIFGNKSIVSLWPLIGTSAHPGPLRPPAPLPTAGRPLVNLTFAINYSISPTSPIGYHAVNVLIHFASSLLLFALMKRTLQLSYFTGRFDASAGWLALATSLIWALHPLQTEAVVYATQRTELMMAFFYLATLYCSLRYWFAAPQSNRRRTWLALAILSSLAGMASKEVMVTAPIMVLLFDRTFVAGSFTTAIRRSWPLYVGLAATWLLLVALNINAPRGDTAGFYDGPSLATWWLTQSQVLLMYFKLVVWPRPLFIHYHLPYLETIGESWMYLAPIALMGIVTLVVLWQNKPLGFLGTWIFAILAPTTVVPIVTEIAAERRMYLPLAALAALFVVGAYVLAQSLWRRFSGDRQPIVASTRPEILFVSAAIGVALVLGLLSARRANAYHDDIGLWRDVIASQPTSAMAHFNLGRLLNKAGRSSEAVVEFETTAKLDPGKAIVFNEIGLILTNAGRLPEAIDAFRTATKLQPNSSASLNNLGHTLTRAGRPAEAIECLRHAIQIHPDYAEAHNNLGIAYGNVGNIPQAIEEFQRALEQNKNYAGAHNNLGLAFNQLGDKSKAIEQLEVGLQLNPNDANAHYNLAAILAGVGRNAEAIPHFEQAIRVSPQFADAHNGLGDALRSAGRTKEAIEHHQIALKIRPDFIDAYASLAQSLALAGQSGEAISVAQKGIEIARSTNQAAAADQVDEWLKHYRIELQRAVDAAPSNSTLQPHEQPKLP
jgi:tetratricopeptide (TPR) repeat protein